MPDRDENRTLHTNAIIAKCAELVRWWQGTDQEYDVGAFVMAVRELAKERDYLRAASAQEAERMRGYVSELKNKAEWTGTAAASNAFKTAAHYLEASLKKIERPEK